MTDKLRRRLWAELRWKLADANSQPQELDNVRTLPYRTQNPAVHKGSVDCVIWDDEAKPWLTVPENKLTLGDK